MFQAANKAPETLQECWQALCQGSGGQTQKTYSRYLCPPPLRLLPERQHSRFNVIIFHILECFPPVTAKIECGPFCCGALLHTCWLLGLIYNNSCWGASQRIPELPLHSRDGRNGHSRVHYGGYFITFTCLHLPPLRWNIRRGGGVTSG